MGSWEREGDAKESHTCSGLDDFEPLVRNCTPKRLQTPWVNQVPKPRRGVGRLAPIEGRTRPKEIVKKGVPTERRKLRVGRDIGKPCRSQTKNQRAWVRILVRRHSGDGERRPKRERLASMLISKNA